MTNIKHPIKPALIMCYSDPANDPRPNRMIRCLKDEYKVTVAGTKEPNIKGINTLIVPEIVSKSLVGKIMNAAFLKLRFFERILWTKEMQILQNKLLSQNFDLIITHDLMLLPLALSVKKNAKVIFDAREYYPRHLEDRFVWRFFFQRFNEFICTAYLHQCDKMITVSESFALEYQRQYRVKPKVVMSFPSYCHIQPSLTNPDRIRLIHHGNANVSRRIELMIEMMDYVDERFTLDLMLMPTQPAYLKKLVNMVSQRQNVRIIPPVSYTEIVPFTNQYDLGLFFVQPSTFNLQYTLANKLFEFIQARLAVAVSPTEMKKIVEKYDCGIVARDFEPKSLAEGLNKLSLEKLTYYKKQSHEAAKKLTAENNCSKIKEIIIDIGCYNVGKNKTL